jgi:hypothetical protein
LATRTSRDNVYAGGIFVAIGTFFVLESLNYELGSLIRMGPGFMPLALGGLLTALGLAVAIVGLRNPEESTNEPPSWRAIGLISTAVLLFGVGIRGLGFIPTVLATALLTAAASRMTNVVGAVTIAVALTALSTLVFVFGLRLQVPLVGPWLRF